MTQREPAWVIRTESGYYWTGKVYSESPCEAKMFYGLSTVQAELGQLKRLDSMRDADESRHNPFIEES